MGDGRRGGPALKAELRARHFLSMGWILPWRLASQFFCRLAARWAAIPILACWIISPALADLINRPIRTAQPFLSSSEQKVLRRIARQTWSFFETFVGPEDNWLPPDNFQEFPQPKIAHRISPTNEGLFIISALAARDFGYISGTNLVCTARTESKYVGQAHPLSRP